MAHARLVQITTAHAKATGDLLASVHRLRAAGVPASAMIILGTIEGQAAALANLNAEQGAIAHRIPDEAPAETGHEEDPAGV